MASNDVVPGRRDLREGVDSRRTKAPPREVPSAEPQPIACAACGEVPGAPAFQWGPSTFIHRCGRCALLFARPLPTAAELQAFYQGFLYRPPARAKLPALIEQRKQELTELFGLSRDAAANAGRRYLDHGGGTG